MVGFVRYKMDKSTTVSPHQADLVNCSWKYSSQAFNQKKLCNHCKQYAVINTLMLEKLIKHSKLAIMFLICHSKQNPFFYVMWFIQSNILPLPPWCLVLDKLAIKVCTFLVCFHLFLMRDCILEPDLIKYKVKSSNLGSV